MTSTPNPRRRCRFRLPGGISAAVAAMLLVAACSPSLDRASDDGAPTTGGAEPPGDVREWAVGEFDTFPTFTAEGEGTETIELPEDVVGARGGVVRVEYTGEDPLTLWAVSDEDGPYMIMLDGSDPVTHDGDPELSGETMWYGANEPPDALRAVGPGRWSLTVHPVAELEMLDSVSDHGGRIFLYDGPQQSFTGTREHQDHRVDVNEIVADPGTRGGGTLSPIDLTTDGNEFSGQLADDYSVVGIGHSGDWTLELSGSA